MITRTLTQALLEALQYQPAVVLLGARQVGKTTLAQQLLTTHKALYVDLEDYIERAGVMQNPKLFCEQHKDELIIFDEIQNTPGLFPVLRGVIDQRRREGRDAGQFLLLGSASLELVKQAGERLAGRVAYLDMTPLHAIEVGKANIETLWTRGGFPQSYLSATDEESFRKRKYLIRSYLEKDIPFFDRSVPQETMQRLWMMLAHLQGQPFNASQIAENLGLDYRKVIAYTDLLVDLMLVRRLQPFHTNIGKRLVKTPLLYIRDSGLVHALLTIQSWDTLITHPIAGASWEGFVIENLLAVAPEGVIPFFYRTSAGAEIDLILLFPDQSKLAVEIKRNPRPKLSKGFYISQQDLQPQHSYVVTPEEKVFPMDEHTTQIGLYGLMQRLRAM
ncbi:MAG: ATP-binding protein [Thiofilum sp.]|uniref:ATP-binding protein n=1 Tax=Thiofilum sp. TaxID=2212733 RepID=UPI0025FFD4E7|nr:ATP-binding protein [Thiofilum sp.]MBK8451941.1 ATP-binding protein [Thiofilum sp.]